MTTTELARANGRNPSKKQRVAQQRAVGNVSRRSTLREYLEQPEIAALPLPPIFGKSRQHGCEKFALGCGIVDVLGNGHQSHVVFG